MEDKIIRKIERRLKHFCKRHKCTYTLSHPGEGIVESELLGLSKKWKVGLCFGTNYPRADLKYILGRISFYEREYRKGFID